MRLIQTSIRNFRGIDDITIYLSAFTTFIGKNNSGKSSAIKAIAMALTNQKPTLDDWPVRIAAKPIEIELIFDQLTEWEKNRPGVSGLVYSEKIHLLFRATYDAAKAKVTTEYFCKKKSEVINGWGEKLNELSPELMAMGRELGISTAKHFTRANQERLKSQIRSQRPELIEVGDEEWTNDGISIDAALQQALPVPIEIPAVLDPTEESKVAAKTAFGRLVSSILIPAIEATNEFESVKTAVDALQLRISSHNEKLEAVRSLEDQLTESISSIIPAKISLEMETPDLGKILSATPVLRVDDGAKTPIQNQGHGLQRSVVFSLIETLGRQSALIKELDGVQNQRATILLFEEPELFLHPHLMRRMRDSLKKVSTAEQYQVLVSTHSPVFVDVADNPKSLVIFRKGPKVVVTQAARDPFATKAEERERLRAMLTFHPTVCEAFFAARTVLVEGNSELALLNHSPELMAKFGIELGKIRDTTIVSCAGKWTIVPMARLLSEFGIDYRVIHDLDAKGRTPDQIANVAENDPHAANKRIAEICGDQQVFVVNDTLENILFLGKATSDKDKPYKCWKQASRLIGNDEERTALTELRKLVEFAFNW